MDDTINSTNTNNDSTVNASEIKVNNAETELTKIEELEALNKKMKTEFDTQRAKMKELFIQKEAENVKWQQDGQILKHHLDELKSQHVVTELKMKNVEIKAQEEISSLQQIVQDTIEESTIYKSELDRLKIEYNRLYAENQELRDVQHESTSLGPHVLSQVKKTLVRKLGGDSMTGNSFHQDSIDKESGKQYAHEDAEMLRSIVVQLKEEMEALKVKLREADDKLQSQSLINDVSNKHEVDSINKSTSIDMLATVLTNCSNCHNHEQKIDDLTKELNNNQHEINELKKQLNEAREDLQKEAALRKDLEDQWQEKRELHKNEVQLLREEVKLNENEMLELQQKFLDTKEEVQRQLQRITEDRERVNKQLEILQADNEFLSGHYLDTAEEIENQYINLPNNVEELQEMILRQQNELIQARVGSEFEKQKGVSSLDEIQLLRDQLDTSNKEYQLYKKNVQIDIKSLQDRLSDYLTTSQQYETNQVNMERKESELNREISKLRVETIELQETIEKLNITNTDLKTKILNLQHVVETNEHVQKDFVQLSQTLQMSLEELRHEDATVRWQEDDDVDKCPKCSINFTVTVRRIHCRHCGHIFCDKCLAKTVPSGPRKRPARVCDVCHTLLSPKAIPYFSTEQSMQ